jgi:DNA-binding CsgD family transcriptional regulator
VLAGQVAEAREDAQRAMELVADVYAQLPAHRWVLVGEPTTGAWLVRVALGVGDRARAEQVAAAAEALARDNPGFPTVTSAAAHVRGLLDADAGALAFAAREGADGWARASAAEDLGVLLTDRDRGRAIRSLEAALTGYEETGAVRDVARVRRRLRRMGVRHRHWVYANRPVAGWGSLTDTERAVALLVTQGWTNRQVAQQMFVSVHTVAFHLRQVFRKLDIGSRVELTRLAVEEGHRPERSRVAREA